jgi:hypothetical protein
LASLRQYGFTFVAALLSAQGLIDFPPTGASTFVPAPVKLAIVLASLALIGAIYVSDNHLRSIQRDVALRAQEIERGFGMELTESVSPRVTRFSAGSIEVIYYLLAVAAGGLGAAAVSPTSISQNSWLLVADIVATAAVVGVIRIVGFLHIRLRQVAWSLDRYRCVKGDVIAVTLTNQGLEPLSINMEEGARAAGRLWWFEADPTVARSHSKEQRTKADSDSEATNPLNGPTIPPNFTLGSGDLFTWWWDTNRVDHGSYILHHVILGSLKSHQSPDELSQRHRSILVESPKSATPAFTTHGD